MSIPLLSSSALFSIEGKNCLVTGGGRGIGKMMAAALVQNGAHVLIAARTEKTLEETALELSSRGPGRCTWVAVDLSTQEGVDSLVQTTQAHFSKLHVLINNAGTSWASRLQSFDEKIGWDEVANLNLKAPYSLSIGLVDLLSRGASAQDPARIIMISSVLSLPNVVEDFGLLPTGFGSWSYNACKAALNELTEALSATLAKHGVTVNAICPGVFRTPLTEFALANERANSKVVAHQPTGRIGTPEDIGGLTLFLCSPAAAHITGGLIPVDGGAFLGHKPRDGRPSSSAATAGTERPLTPRALL